MTEVKITRECNRHFDCDQAEQKSKARWLKANPNVDPRFCSVPVDFHCHDAECSECFGN